MFMPIISVGRDHTIHVPIARHNFLKAIAMKTLGAGSDLAGAVSGLLQIRNNDGSPDGPSIGGGGYHNAQHAQHIPIIRR